MPVPSERAPLPGGPPLRSLLPPESLPPDAVLGEGFWALLRPWLLPGGEGGPPEVGLLLSPVEGACWSLPEAPCCPPRSATVFMAGPHWHVYLRLAGGLARGRGGDPVSALRDALGSEGARDGAPPAPAPYPERVPLWEGWEAAARDLLDGRLRPAALTHLYLRAGRSAPSLRLMASRGLRAGTCDGEGRPLPHLDPGATHLGWELLPAEGEEGLREALRLAREGWWAALRAAAWGGWWLPDGHPACGPLARDCVISRVPPALVAASIELSDALRRFGAAGLEEPGSARERPRCGCAHWESRGSAWAECWLPLHDLRDPCRCAAPWELRGDVERFLHRGLPGGAPRLSWEAGEPVVAFPGTADARRGRALSWRGPEGSRVVRVAVRLPGWEGEEDFLEADLRPDGDGLRDDVLRAAAAWHRAAWDAPRDGSALEKLSKLRAAEERALAAWRRCGYPGEPL